MRIASLDLGTNALLLTIANWDGNSLTAIHEEVSLIRLGQHLRQTGKLHTQAIARCLDTLDAYCSLMNDHRVETVVAVGTEALRSAENGPQLIEEIENRYGILFRIIDGSKEARLAFKATQNEFADLEEDLLMFDIGGGSTEIVIGDSANINFISSLDIGTVSLTEQFIQHDPIFCSELDRAESFIRKSLLALSLDIHHHAGVGVAGTVTTLKAVTLKMAVYNHGAVHKSTLTKGDVDRLLKLFFSLTNAERLKLKGLPEKRADIIPMGALITQCILDVFDLQEIYVSDRGLRWGLLYDWVEKEDSKQQ